MNCKPGDLAYIVKSATGASVGRVVEVVKSHGIGPNGPDWNVRTREPFKVVMRDGSGIKKSKNFLMPDAWLRPISGVPVHDERRDEVPA